MEQLPLAGALFSRPLGKTDSRPWLKRQHLWCLGGKQTDRLR